MFYIDTDVKEKLAGVEDFSEFFTGQEFTAWINLIKERQGVDDKQLRKTLGVAYVPTLNYANSKNEDRGDLITKLGLDSVSDEYIAKLAFLLYKDEEFKAYGDAEVTEALNYFEFEDGETIKSYWALSA